MLESREYNGVGEQCTAVETNDIRPDDKSHETALDQRAQIEDILKRIDALPILNTRPDIEIVGY